MSVDAVLVKGKQFEASRKQCLDSINEAAKEVCQELSELKIKYGVRHGSNPDDRVEIFFYIEHETGKIDSLGINYSNALSKKSVAEHKSLFLLTIEHRFQQWIKNGSDK